MTRVTLTKAGVKKEFKSKTDCAKYLKVSHHILEFAVYSKDNLIKGYKLELHTKEVKQVDYKFEKWAAEAFGIKKEDLLKSEGVNNKITYARYICYLYLIKNDELRFTEIGYRYAKKHHSTVSYGVKRANELLQIKDTQFTMGLVYFNDMLEEHNIINKDHFKVVKSWIFTDKERKTMQFMQENNILIHKIAEHYGLSIYDLKNVLKDDKI